MRLHDFRIMGLLSQGSPLGWEDSKAYADHIRDHGIKQLIALYNRVKDRDLDRLKWGDEVTPLILNPTSHHSHLLSRLSTRWCMWTIPIKILDWR